MLFLLVLYTAWKVFNYFWSVFPCIHSEYMKIRTRNNSVFGHFSRSVYVTQPHLTNDNVKYIQRLRKFKWFWVIMGSFLIWFSFQRVVKKKLQRILRITDALNRKTFSSLFYRNSSSNYSCVQNVMNRIFYQSSVIWLFTISFNGNHYMLGK